MPYKQPWQAKRGLVVGKAKRAAVFERGAHRCVMCGRRDGDPYYNKRRVLAYTVLEIDHIIPRSAGGTSHPDNLQVMCSSCNGRKGAKR